HEDAMEGGMPGFSPELLGSAYEAGPETGGPVRGVRVIQGQQPGDQAIETGREESGPRGEGGIALSGDSLVASGEHEPHDGIWELRCGVRRPEIGGRRACPETE